MKKNQFVARGAIIAALYVVLTVGINAFGLASGAIQIRISEALTILPAFTGAAVPGLFIGCVLSNLITGAPIWDVVFGSIATLLGAAGTYYFGKKKFTAPIFPIAANTIIIPFVLKLAYGLPDSTPYLMLTIFIGEFLSCGVLGCILYAAVEKSKYFKK